MRLATWNVERVKPKGWKIAPAQRQRMREVDADIWVLTETHVDHAPSEAHTGVFSPPFPERRPPGERWAAIWSRFPIRPIDDPAPHPRGTVAARIETPFGALLVYACVIPWANERTLQDGRRARPWEAHFETIGRIDRELERLRGAHPPVPFALAGDFNQDRDGSGWYGTDEVRERLTALLARHDLTCRTSADMVASGQLAATHLVDHICVSRALATDFRVLCWEKTTPDGLHLSDHPTVALDLL